MDALLAQAATSRDHIDKRFLTNRFSGAVGAAYLMISRVVGGGALIE
jgi:hypothetical protein